MTDCAVFQNDAGGVSVVYPANAAAMTVAFAKANVPAGKAFKIIDAATLPGRDTRALWTVDPLTLTDGVGERT